MINLTLYKLDSKGKTRVWYARPIEDELHTTHGLEGGNLITDVTKCTAKNAGRANYLSPEDQAIKECAALYEKKLNRDGYTETKGETLSYIQPMLARDYSKVSHQLDWAKPTCGSTKLDGVRAIWIKGKGFQSRKGTFYKVPHLEEALKDIYQMLDGELYIHGQPLNRIVAAVKKPNELTPEIEFRVFDIIDDGIYSNRFVKAQIAVALTKHPKVCLVKQTFIHNHDEMLTQFQQHVANGYEGIMIRQDGAYKQGQRSESLYKYKEFLEDEFIIKGVKADKCNQAIMECEGFDVRMKGTDGEREFQLQNPEYFIGKQVTVRYFTMTEYGKPQFPIGITIRDDL
jgi:DNA ligase-1